MKKQLKERQIELALAKKELKNSITKSTADSHKKIVEISMERVDKLKKKKAKQPANIILEHESSEGEVASSEEEESEDESDNESDDHYKIYPKTELDDDIIEIVS